MKTILGERANINTLESKDTLEIRDLDWVTTKEEVRAAIKEQLGDPDSKVKITLTNSNSRGLWMATV